MGSLAEVRGAEAVAATFKGRALAVEPALVDGEAGAVWAQAGRPRVAFTFVIEGGRILEIELLMDPARLGALELVLPGA